MPLTLDHVRTLLGDLTFLSRYRNRDDGTTGEALSETEKTIKQTLERHVRQNERVVIPEETDADEPLARYLERHIRLVEHVHLENHLPLYADTDGQIVYDIGDGLGEFFQLRVIVHGYPDDVYLPSAQNGSVANAVNRVVAALVQNGRPETPDGVYAAVTTVELDLVGEHRGSVPLTRRDVDLLPDDSSSE